MDTAEVEPKRALRPSHSEHLGSSKVVHVIDNDLKLIQPDSALHRHVPDSRKCRLADFSQRL